MNFQDVVNFSKEQKEILISMDSIITQLANAKSIYKGWSQYAFDKLYSGNIATGNQSGSARDYTRDSFNKFRECLISIDAYDLAIVLSKLKSCFKNESIESYIGDIEMNYKNIVQYRAYTETADRIGYLESCINSIDNVINTYQVMKHILNYIEVVDTELSKGVKLPTLVIRSDIEEVTEDSIKYIIEPIKSMYSKLCEIANINIKEEPLRILRMESGTIEFKFDGNGAISKVIASIIETYHNIFIKNHTRQGKKDNLVESMELVSKELNLIETMNSLGIDTSEMKEIAKETMAGLVKQADTFLSANPDVKINDKQISRGDDIKRLLSQPRYLESATESYVEEQ